MPKRVLSGLVVKKSGDKTVSVLVERQVKHPKYNKRIKLSKKYSVHDQENECKIGDRISFIESKPISKNKRWALHTEAK